MSAARHRSTVDLDALEIALRRKPGVSIGLIRLCFFMFGAEMIVGAAVFWMLR